MIGLIGLASCCVIATPFALRAAGVISPPADVVYGAAPDQYASSQVQDVLSEANLDGVRVYVIPAAGSDTQTAFIVMDSSKGFDGFSDMGTNTTTAVVDDRVDGIVRDLVARNQSEDLRITIIALDYRDENGDTFTILTTTMEQAESYVRGELGKDQFYGGFELRLGDMIKQLWEGYNE